MKYLIIGLGNIGAKYQNTRHNIGFDVLDAIAKEQNIDFELDKYAFVAKYKFKGRTIILIKPTTYMNLSGKAINYWLQKEKIPVENSLTIVDDLNLDFGTIRIKPKGSHGGHNGLSHICETLGNCNFPRMRFGVGDSFSRGKQTDFVLGKWSETELIDLHYRVQNMCEAVNSFATAGLKNTMNNFNGKIEEIDK